MPLTATHINYYHICHRKLWLFANGITMEHTSDTVYDGKLLHETSYPQRAESHSEMELSAITEEGNRLSGKIDYYDAKENTIHETKRSDKAEEAHEWQSKFYIFLLELNGIKGAQCILEFPKQRETRNINLTEADRVYLKEVIKKITAIVASDECPARINAKICKSCSYYDLCYIEEV